MKDAEDVIVVGGGHNGLVAAAYLARAGRRVLLLERRPILGGAATTEEFHPGFRANSGAALVGLLRPEVVRDLELPRHGLAFLPADPEVVNLGLDGHVLRLWHDDTRTRQELASFSARDADAYVRFRDLLAAVAAAADPAMVETPPDVSALALGDQLGLLRRAWRLRRLGKDALNQVLRMATMSLEGVLREWFETDLLRASLAADALLGTGRGPWSPGTAFLLLHHFAAAAQGASWSFVRGGTGLLAASLEAAARQAGVVVRTGAEVAHILTQDGRATGVQLASGDTLSARIVVSGADPKRTFLGLVDPSDLDLSFLQAVRNIRTEGVVARVNFALDREPAIPMAGGAAVAVPRFRIAPSLEYLERAYDDAKYGGLSRAPFLDTVVPTLVDPSLAPTGKHVASVLVQYAPYRLREGSWDAMRDAIGDLVERTLDRFVPGFRASVLGREILTPADLERRFGLTGGHIYHGEMTLDQQFFMRPVPGWARYRTPVDGLFLCGSGAHPGGGITGAPGYNAAREILRSTR